MTITTCVFDAYGTLFDFASAAAGCADVLGEKTGALSALWRDKQLQYTWLRGLGGHHVEVAVDEQCPARRVRPGQTDEDIAAPGRPRLQILRLVTDLAQLLGHPPGALRLTLGGRRIAGVGGVELDQSTDNSDHLVGRPVRRIVKPCPCHRPFLPLGAPHAGAGVP